MVKEGHGSGWGMLGRTHTSAAGGGMKTCTDSSQRHWRQLFNIRLQGLGGDQPAKGLVATLKSLTLLSPETGFLFVFGATSI